MSIIRRWDSPGRTESRINASIGSISPSLCVFLFTRRRGTERERENSHQRRRFPRSVDVPPQPLISQPRYRSRVICGGEQKRATSFLSRAIFHAFCLSPMQFCGLRGAFKREEISPPPRNNGRSRGLISFLLRASLQHSRLFRVARWTNWICSFSFFPPRLLLRDVLCPPSIRGAAIGIVTMKIRSRESLRE